MKEQLNNITRELQEITTKELTQQEKKEHEKLYKKELKKEIKATLQQEIEEQQEKGETIDNIYKYIIINSDTFKDNIINTLYNYKIETTRKKPQAIEYQDESKNKIEYITLFNYPFKNYDIAEDVEDQFYKILKSVINKYNLIGDVLKNDVLEELKQLFLQYYNNYNYTIARETLYNEQNKNAIIIATAPRSRKIVQDNYYKTLNEIDRNYKIEHPEETKEQKAQKQNGIIKHKKTLLFGSFIVGAIDGLKKASK